MNKINRKRIMLLFVLMLLALNMVSSISKAVETPIPLNNGNAGMSINVTGIQVNDSWQLFQQGISGIFTNTSSINIVVPISNGTAGMSIIVTGWYVPSYLNDPPIINNPNPANNSNNQNRSFTWSCNIEDPEGVNVTWTIECNNSQTSSGTGEANGTKSLSLSGLAYSTTYTVWVNATDEDATNYTRNWYTFTTGPPEVPITLSSGTAGMKVYIEYFEWTNWSEIGYWDYISLGQPSSFTASTLDNTSINLTWTKGYNATHTYIERNSISSWNRTEGIFVCNTTSSGYDNIGLGVNTQYYYRAWSYNSTQNNFTQSVSTNNYTKPDVPNSFVYIEVSSDSITLSWSNGVNTSQVEIRMNETGWADYPNSNTNGTQKYLGGGTTKEITSLSSNTTFYFSLWGYSSSSGFYSDQYVSENVSTTVPTIAPDDLEAVTINSTAISLTWVKGNETDDSTLKRNTGSYPTLTTGTEIYNASGTSFTDTGLIPATHYYYRVWGWDGFNHSIGYSSDDNITKPRPPQNMIGSLNNTVMNITWEIGTGATTTVIANSTDSYPTDPEGAGVFYNGSSNATDNIGISGVIYYTAWSCAYVDGEYVYSEPAYVTWGGLEINCYVEGNDTQNLTFDVFITNEDGSEIFQATNCDNPYFVGTAEVPNSQTSNDPIAIQISSSGYHTRIYYLELYENEIYTLNAYLPHDAPGEGSGGGGGDPSHPDYDENETYAELYLLTVIDPYDEGIPGVKVEIDRAINVSGELQYTPITIIYTDTNGQVDVYLIPGTLYKVQLSKTGYVTSYQDYIPSADIHTYTFKMVYTPYDPGASETLLQNITWSLEPTQRYFDNSFTVYYNISSSDSKLEYYRMECYYYNETTLSWLHLNTTNISSSPSGGSINYTFPNITGKYKVGIFFKKTNFSEYELTETGSTFFFIYWGGYPTQVTADIPDFIYLAVVCIIMAIVMGFLIRYTGIATGYIGIGIFALALVFKPDLTAITGVSGWAILAVTALMYTIGLFLWSRL